MRRLSNLILCLLIGTSVLADDGPASAPKPAQENTPEGQLEKSLDLKPVRSSDPFDDERPIGARAAKERDDKGPGKKTKSEILDPFGNSVPSTDRFKQDSDAAAGKAASPFAENPFAKPRGRKKRAFPLPPGFGTQQATVQPNPSPIPSITLEESSESRQRIEAQLATETDFDYLDTPLKDVIDEIALRHGIPIVISIQALEDFGIGTDTPITISLAGVSLRSALRLMLRELDLTFLIEDEVLQITTPEDAEGQLQSRFYSVSILLPATGDGDYLVKLITKLVAPESWDEVGGPGAITFIDHLETLAVTQTSDVIHQIDRLLASVAKLSEHSRSR